MVDLVITGTNVVPESGAIVKSGVAGATIAAGQPVYLDANNVLQLSDANLAAANKVAGIALNGAVAGQPVSYCSRGPVTVGSVLTAAALYVLSSTAGAIAPVADLSSTEYTTVIGYAIDADSLFVLIVETGVVTA